MLPSFFVFFYRVLLIASRWWRVGRCGAVADQSAPCENGRTCRDVDVYVVFRRPQLDADGRRHCVVAAEFLPSFALPGFGVFLFSIDNAAPPPFAGRRLSKCRYRVFLLLPGFIVRTWGCRWPSRWWDVFLPSFTEFYRVLPVFPFLERGKFPWGTIKKKRLTEFFLMTSYNESYF